MLLLPINYVICRKCRYLTLTFIVYLLLFYFVTSKSRLMGLPWVSESIDWWKPCMASLSNRCCTVRVSQGNVGKLCSLDDLLNQRCPRFEVSVLKVLVKVSIMVILLDHSSTALNPQVHLLILLHHPKSLLLSYCSG